MWRSPGPIVHPTGNAARRWIIRGGRIVAGLMALAMLAGCGESSTPESTAGGTEAAPAAETKPAETPPKPRPESVQPIVEVLREPDPFTRAAKLATLLPTLDAVAGENVHLLLRDPTLDLGNVESALLVRFWSQHQPEEASDWALFKSPLSRRGAAVEIAFARWAGTDPQAAVQDLLAFMSIPSPFTRDAEIALVKGWFDSGKPGLEDYMKSLGVGFTQQRAVATYAHELANRDGVQAALDWATSVDDGDEAYKKAALRQTGSAVAMRDPLAAAAWCDRICDQKIATNLRAMVAQRWAAQDGRAAIEWVEKAPAGQERDWAARSAFWGWWRHDPEGFEAWLASAVDDGVPAWLDDAVEIYAAQLAGGSRFEEGIDWGGRILDDEARTRTLMNVARLWYRSDQAAAEAWLEKSPLSEENRDKVRHPEPGHKTKPVEEEEEDD